MLRDPFDLKKEEDALLVARYLIEENSEDWVYFDENETREISIVKSIFKNLIKSYKLFD